MKFSEVAMFQLVAVAACCVASAMAHTVYRYPEKLPVLHQHHQHQHQQQQHGYDTYNTHQAQQHVYHTPLAKHVDQSRPNAHCQYNGDIIKNPHDRCSYLECHYGDEPWYDQQGKAQLYARVRQCPPGTAVAKDAKHILFRPIQYDPTRRIYQGGAKGYDNHGYSRHGYQHQPTYEYKNTYADMTAICSEAVQAKACKGY